jgi:hypothetical protein
VVGARTGEGLVEGWCERHDGDEAGEVWTGEDAVEGRRASQLANVVCGCYKCFVAMA